MDPRRFGSRPYAEDAPVCPNCGSRSGAILAAGCSVGDGDFDLCAAEPMGPEAHHEVLEVGPVLGVEAGSFGQVCLGDGTDEGGGAALPLPGLGSARTDFAEGGQARVVALGHVEDGACPVCGRVSGEVFLQRLRRCLS